MVNIEKENPALSGYKVTKVYDCTITSDTYARKYDNRRKIDTSYLLMIMKTMTTTMMAMMMMVLWLLYLRHPFNRIWQSIDRHI